MRFIINREHLNNDPATPPRTLLQILLQLQEQGEASVANLDMQRNLAHRSMSINGTLHLDLYGEDAAHAALYMARRSL